MGAVAPGAVKVELRGEDQSLEVELESSAELERFFSEAKPHKGFVLELGQELALFETLQCRFSTADGFDFSLPIEVVQVFPRDGDETPTFATAFQISDWKRVPEAQIRRLAQDRERQEAEHPAEVSPIFRIRKMNPNQRFRLAMKASRTERQILLRDNTPQVLIGLLSHPRIEDKEVLEIVKSNYASGGVLQRVADSRKWMQNRDIKLAVVRNPKTPVTMAQKLLAGLATRDLRMLAKMGNAREVLRKAALRLYLQRTKSNSGQL